MNKILNVLMLKTCIVLGMEQCDDYGCDGGVECVKYKNQSLYSDNSSENENIYFESNSSENQIPVSVKNKNELPQKSKKLSQRNPEEIKSEYLNHCNKKDKNKYSEEAIKLYENYIKPSEKKRKRKFIKKNRTNSPTEGNLKLTLLNFLTLNIKEFENYKKDKINISEKKIIQYMNKSTDNELEVLNLIDKTNRKNITEQYKNNIKEEWIRKNKEYQSIKPRRCSLRNNK